MNTFEVFLAILFPLWRILFLYIPHVLKIYFCFMCIGVLSAYMSMKVPDTLELELHTVLSHQVGTGS